MTQQTPAIRFGKNARMEIAPWNGGNEPALADFTYFCATNEIKIGSSKGTETINNFCTGGNDVEVNDGSEKPTLSTGDATWTENDKALQILANAYAADTEDNQQVWYYIYPIGKGDGKPVYRGILSVKDWELTIPSKGTIKMKNTLNPLGRPEYGTITGGVFTPAPTPTFTVTASAPTAPAALTPATPDSGVAATLPDSAANQQVNYTVTTNAQGDLVVTVTGSSTPRTVTILDGANAVKATGTDSATFAAAPAGAYTVRVDGAQANTGGNVTITHA